MTFEWSDECIRKLIGVVRINSYLYDKRQKLFKDMNVKSLTWENVAKNIAEKCTGEEASRKFKSLRDIFAKERKKIKECEGRSGDGWDKTSEFTSSWEYYDELLFLTEHITGRRKTIASVIKKNVPKNALQEPGPSVEEYKENKKPNEVAMSETEETISNWLSGEEEISYDVDFTDAESLLSTNDSNATPSRLSQKSSSPSIREKAVRSFRVPTPDLQWSKNKRRKYSVDKDIEVLDNIAATARQVIDTISADNSSASATLSMTDHFAQSVAGALKQIPAQSQFRCMSKIMEILDIYNRGKEIKIIELD